MEPKYALSLTSPQNNNKSMTTKSAIMLFSTLASFIRLYLR